MIVIVNWSARRSAAATPRAPQGRWLAEQLDGAPRCTIAAFHRPRFSSGLEHGGDPALEPLWGAARRRRRRRRPQRARARLRAVPSARDADGRVGTGPAEFVVGTGGHSLRAFSRVEPRQRGALGRLGRRAGDDPAARRLRLALRRPGRHPARSTAVWGTCPGAVGGRELSTRTVTHPGAGSPLDEGDPGPHRGNPRARRHSPRVRRTQVTCCCGN